MWILFSGLLFWLSAFAWVLIEVKTATLQVLEDLQDKIKEIDFMLKEQNIDFDVHEYARSFFGETANINYYLHFLIKCPSHARALIFSRSAYLNILKTEMYSSFLTILEQVVSEVVESSNSESPSTEIESLSSSEIDDLKN